MVAAGETPLDAMKREAAEEAGLTPEDYELVPETVFLTSRPTESGWMLERAYCYTARLRDGVTPHNVDGEVQATELLDADAMAELIARGKVTSEASLAALHWLAAKVSIRRLSERIPSSAVKKMSAGILSGAHFLLSHSGVSLSRQALPPSRP